MWHALCTVDIRAFGFRGLKAGDRCVYVHLAGRKHSRQAKPGLGCASRLRLPSVREEVLEPGRRQLGVADRMPDVLVAEISLD